MVAVDESAIVNNVAAQIPKYTIQAVPASNKGTIFVKDKDTAGTASLSGNPKGGGSAYALDATSFTQVTSGGDPTNPNTVAGLSITEAGALTFNANTGFANIATGETTQISGTYGYTDANGSTKDTDFIITITGTAGGPTASFLSSVSAQQELSIEELRSLKFLAAPNGSGEVEFKYVVSDSGSDDGTDNDLTDNDNSITETIKLDILAFNDVPELPSTTIAMTNGTEDKHYIFNQADLLKGVTDPDIEYTNGQQTGNPYGDVLSVDDLSVTNGSLIYYVADTGITSSQTGLSGTVKGGGTAYSLDTASINKVEANGTTTNPNAISGFSLTATGALAFNPNHADFDGLATGETIQISGAYNYTDANSAAASNQFIITITSDGNTRTATYLSGSDTSNSTLGAYGFTPDDDFNGTVKFSYLIKDGQGGSISNTVPVKIASVNDAPEALYKRSDGAEGSSKIKGQLTSLDIDT